MLSPARLSELRSALEAAQNPLFLYDNDADGLCSYILLRRFLGRGDGMAVRTHPEIDVGYAHTALSRGADVVIVLDCPFLGAAFVDLLAEHHIPIIWIDHHKVDSPHYTHAQVRTFNPALARRGASAEPVTYLSYQVTKRRQDMWIALMGCIADHYFPRFTRTFARLYPDLWNASLRSTKPFAVYYGSDIGRLARALGFGLKDSITHVRYLQRFLIGSTGPHDMVKELESSSSFASRVKNLRAIYDPLFEEACASAEKRLVFFQYGGTMSMSADLANELSYTFPGRLIVVGYVHGGLCNLSLRGRNVKRILERLLPSFEGASGGGHQDAVGARMATADLERFKAMLLETGKRL